MTRKDDPTISYSHLVADRIKPFSGLKKNPKGGNHPPSVERRWLMSRPISMHALQTHLFILLYVCYISVRTQEPLCQEYHDNIQQ